jgi:tetratricopeptide (TPR) repeat protein
MKVKNILTLILLLILVSSCATYGPHPPTEVKAGENDFNARMEKGIQHLNRGEFEKALGEFQEAVAINPKSARANNLSGIAYFQQKNYRAAEKMFKTATSLNPSYAEAWNNLGSVSSIREDYDQAIKMFKKALSLEPNSLSANYSLGFLLISLGQVEEGTTYLSRGIALDPDYLEKHKSFVSVLAIPARETPEVYFAYAGAYAARGNVDKVVEYLTKAKNAGFRDWQRIATEKEFEKVRQDSRIKEFIR